MTTDQAETARQIERAYTGYHVFVSDEGWWYASRARGQSQTVCGANPDELTRQLSAEETAAVRAHQDALTAP